VAKLQRRAFALNMVLLQSNVDGSLNRHVKQARQQRLWCVLPVGEDTTGCSQYVRWLQRNTNTVCSADEQAAP
jgi:hypothetical protein